MKRSIRNRKLTLNKMTIAALNRPERIKGGWATVTQNTNQNESGVIEDEYPPTTFTAPQPENSARTTTGLNPGG